MTIQPSIAEWQAMSVDERKAKIASGILPPIMGADDGPPADPNNPAPQDPAPPAEPPAPPTPPAPKPEDPMARERRRGDAEKKRADELQKQIDERNRKEAEEQGRHQELAETERKRADELQAQLDSVNAERTVERIASQPQFGADEENGVKPARFINPDEALALLPSNTDLTDEDAVKTALTELATTRPHLLQRTTTPTPPTPPATPPSTGSPGNPAPTDKPKITREYIDSLSVQETRQLMKDRPDDVQAALAAP